MSNSPEASVLEKTKLSMPNMWTVVFLNDDYTPMNFVVEVLMEVFHLDDAAAKEVMMTVHLKGRAPVGRYTKEIAMTKAALVMRLAEELEHPLVASPEQL
jgi:ATP-dependent Clp protease adaptor protein ClpS